MKMLLPVKIFSILLIGFAIPTLASAQSDQSAAPETWANVQELKSDFAIFRASLEEGHPALYRYRSKKEMDRIFDAAEASLSRQITDREFVVLLSKVAAKIGDGHMRVIPPETQVNGLEKGSTAVPFQPYWSNHKLYIWRDYSNLADSQFLGAEIISINGRSIKDLLKEYLLVVPSDGNNTTHKYRLLENARLFTRYLFILNGYAESYEVKYLPAGTRLIKTGRLAGLRFEELLKIRRIRYPDIEDRSPTEFEITSSNNSAYLRIATFDNGALEAAKINFTQFLKTSFKSLEENHIDNLILDVRGNGGGTDEFGRLLFSYFTNQPFDYYSSVRMNKESYEFFKYTGMPGGKAPEGMMKANSDGTFDNIKHPNVGLQTPTLPTFSGRVFVLINGSSFSTTSEFMSLLHFHTKATFIGEESGGGYYGNCSGPTPEITLPYSKVRVEMPLMKYSMAVKDYPLSDRGLMPTHTIIPTISDKLGNKDVELDFARQLLKKPEFGGP